MNSNLIEISFTGDKIKPDTIKAGELAEVLKAIEDTIESKVFLDYPELSREQVVIGLVNIGSSSIDLQFKSAIPEITQSAFRDIGRAISTNDFSLLPSHARESLIAVVGFTKKKNCIAELVLINGTRNVLAVISPETNIEHPPMISGEATIFGKVVRVGGRTPRVMVEMVNGNVIYCGSEIDIARKLGEKLYMTVGLSGKASWDSSSLKIERFYIKKITEYEDLSISDAMNQLSKIAGGIYAQVINVDTYVASLRQ